MLELVLVLVIFIISFVSFSDGSVFLYERLCTRNLCNIFDNHSAEKVWEKCVWV